MWLLGLVLGEGGISLTFSVENSLTNMASPAEMRKCAVTRAELTFAAKPTIPHSQRMIILGGSLDKSTQSIGTSRTGNSKTTGIRPVVSVV